MVSHDEFENIWKKPAVKIGFITVIIPTLMCFLPNIYLYLRYGAFPPVSVALKSWGMIAAIFGAFYVVEPVSYYPILGLTGTYISFLSGNIGNLRVPCSAVAQEVVGVEAGSPEAEIVSTLGLTGSVVTNLFFTTLAAIAGTALLAVFPEPIAIAFKQYTVAAIFGAVFGQFTLKYPKLAVAGIAIPLLIYIVAPKIGLGFLTQTWIVIVASVFGTIAVGRLLYKKGLL
ncbi:hypothetical protein RBH88_00990 [Aminobacterium sp. MB27-C1]|uniref:hypothetical protein n=1 Tax=unclassified Aminobacterium TaxID=2685012 RepID=UPI001BD19C73|nr:MULTISPECIES: hypothetical protein [unclassified Aminobacterium]MDD4552143.1 hypothetical protein [Aminobacterium sp.]MEA4877867.1 hypothetical protein [Aminobacterium sp.]WMI71694.1 hypothetical protein RBH88_00990 [Aminobacterium sp. MB27-C1]